MHVFDHPDFDDHEQVVFCREPRSGLRAIIAIHDTRLGPALGGCRMYPYADEESALRDALRLARGMTYKSALAGLALGGGKSVIIGDPRKHKTPALLAAMARCIDRLGGRYIAAEDSGTGVADLQAMAAHTRHVAGIQPRITADGQPRSGDPSPATAYGVFCGLRAAVARRLGSGGLAGIRVAIQGVGNVGWALARHLHEAGAVLLVADAHAPNAERAVRALGATMLPPDAILSADVEVLAPCALGAVLDDRSIAGLRARVVAGSANNQLAEDRHGEALRRRGILYAPDYVINAGGVIDVAMERTGFDARALHERLEGIAETLERIFGRAEADGLATNLVADRMARESLAGQGSRAAQLDANRAREGANAQRVSL